MSFLFKYKNINKISQKILTETFPKGSNLKIKNLKPNLQNKFDIIFSIDSIFNKPQKFASSFLHEYKTKKYDDRNTNNDIKTKISTSINTKLEQTDSHFDFQMMMKNILFGKLKISNSIIFTPKQLENTAWIGNILLRNETNSFQFKYSTWNNIFGMNYLHKFGKSIYAGSEIYYYNSAAKSVQLSTAFGFKNREREFTTIFSLIGNLVSSYSIRLSSDCFLSTSFDVNIFSRQSNFSIGTQFSPPKLLGLIRKNMGKKFPFFKPNQSDSSIVKNSSDSNEKNQESKSLIENFKGFDHNFVCKLNFHSEEGLDIFISKQIHEKMILNTNLNSIFSKTKPKEFGIGILIK
ncbi:distribution and morphology protein [Anaeramoeba ignava]|uniref:Distribution and morphology protein n=1 Tax=Anaeramoeba ignava TaxID=1746090 RepID=A0A9Q0LFI5_ANAIG|nr:distribution and morphology protein [Anaeramoeba ignava]